MPVFNKKGRVNNRKNKFAGVHLPPQINSYFTLFTLAMEVSKSAVLVDLLQNWIEANKESAEFSETALINLIVERAAKTFAELKDNKTFTKSRFYNEITQELLVKGVSDETVTSIITKVKNGTK